MVCASVVKKKTHLCSRRSKYLCTLTYIGQPQPTGFQLGKKTKHRKDSQGPHAGNILALGSSRKTQT